MSEKNNEKYRVLLFSVQRSVRYHVKRRQFFEFFGKFVKVVVVFSGVGIFSTLLAKMGSSPLALTTAAIVALFSTIDLVIGPIESAGLHSDLSKRFIDLEKEMIQIDGESLTDKRVGRIQGCEIKHRGGRAYEERNIGYYLS